MKTQKILLTAAMAVLMSTTVYGAEQSDGSTPIEIGVFAQREPEELPDEVISVDVAWENMVFTYGGGTRGTWNSQTHLFEQARENAWSQNTAEITVKNHSNVQVQADFAFQASTGGILGNFSKNRVILDRADTEPYLGDEESGTFVTPTASTSFGIDGSSAPVSENQRVGSITISISAYRGMPIWTEESNISASGTIGFTDMGRSEWASGDEVLVCMSYTEQRQSNQYLTLTYNGTDWTGAESVRYADRDKVTITAWYAPCYQWSNGQLVLKEGKTAGTEEFVSGVGTIVADKKLSISFRESKRDYFRFRFSTVPNQKLHVYIVDFVPAGPAGAVAPDWYQDEYYTIQADGDGNAYLYGTLADLENGDISLCDEKDDYINGWIFDLNESVVGSSLAFEAKAPLQIADHTARIDVNGAISDEYFTTMVKRTIATQGVTKIKVYGVPTRAQQRILAQQLSGTSIELDLGLMGKDEILPELMDNSQLTIIYGYEKKGTTYHIYDDRGIQGAVDDLKKAGSGNQTATIRLECDLLFDDAVAARSYTYVGALIEQGEITIDLNGHTMQTNGLSAVLYLQSSANVTVTDSSQAQTGKIKAKDGMQAIIVRGASFTLEKGMIESEGYGIECEDGFVTINGGTLQAGELAAGIFYNVDNKLGKITINGGQISGDRAAVVAYWNALEIHGGTLTGRTALEMNLYQESTLTAKITGGTFVGTECDISTNQTGILQGGTFTDGLQMDTAQSTDVNSVLAAGYGYVDDAGQKITPVDGQKEISGTVTVKKNP